MKKTNKYNLEVSNETLIKSLKRIINLIYKLLPMREEGNDWEKPLETIASFEFKSCTNLHTLSFPETMKKFGSSVFEIFGKFCWWIGKFFKDAIPLYANEIISNS